MTLPFDERYCLQRLDDGGVIVDLETGNYSRVNRAGADIFHALITSEDLKAATTQVAARLGLPDEAAAKTIADLLAALEAAAPRVTRPDPFVYSIAASLEGYMLSSNGTERLWMSADGLTVRGRGTAPSPQTVARLLRAAAPRLLFLQGAAVLHASAMRIDQNVIAVCGDSGAGKTTTARAFHEAGSPLVAEDMLVVARPSPLTIHGAGEERINEWAIRSADELCRAGQADASGLRAAFDGAPISVAQIWFISRDRRQEGEIVSLRRLGPSDATLAVMTGVFLGSTSEKEWRRFLSFAGAIAASTPVFQARMPSGLAQLRTAAELYTRSSTS